MGVIERLDPEMVTRAEQPPVAAIPDRKSEVAKKLPDALFAPGRVGAQNQFAVGRRAPARNAARLQFPYQLIARVEARVRGDPYSSIEARGLALAARFVRRAQ